MTINQSVHSIGGRGVALDGNDVNLDSKDTLTPGPGEEPTVHSKFLSKLVVVKRSTQQFLLNTFL